MIENEIEQFLQAARFAVAGTSADSSKYGNKVLKALAKHGKQVVGLHPVVTNIEGISVFKRLADLPEPVQSLSIVTPPAVTATVVADAIEHGVQSIWMQPGAENEEAIRTAREHGITVIAGGPCILVALALQSSP